MRLERVIGLNHAASATAATGTTGAPMHKCIALALDGTTGAFACSIYATRPDACRDLANGSDGCRGELAAKRGRPKRWLALLTS